MLIEIFKYLPPKYLCDTSLVCVRFYKLIITTKKLWSTFTILVNKENVTNNQLISNEHRKFANLRVMSCFVDFKRFNELFAENLTFISLKNVTIRTLYFYDLMSNSPNILTLIMNNCGFADVDLNVPKLKCKQLTHLEMVHGCTEDEFFDFFKDATELEFLGSQEPDQDFLCSQTKLKNFVLNCDCPSDLLLFDQDLSKDIKFSLKSFSLVDINFDHKLWAPQLAIYVENLLKFLFLHEEMENLAMDIYNILKFEHVRSILMHLKKVKKLSLCLDKDDYDEELFDFTCLAVEDFSIALSHTGHSTRWKLVRLEHLFGRFPNIRKLSMQFELRGEHHLCVPIFQELKELSVYWSQIGELKIMNDMENVKLTLSNVKSSPRNWREFVKMNSSITDLTINCLLSHDSDGIIAELAKLKNLKKLAFTKDKEPKIFETDTLKKLLLNCRYLKDMNLGHICGSSEDFQEFFVICKLRDIPVQVEFIPWLEDIF